MRAPAVELPGSVRPFLLDALQGLQPSEDLNLLIGFETSNDVAAYRRTPEIAVVSTVDFITPSVDDL